MDTVATLVVTRGHQEEPVVRYNDAARCPGCEMRAILDQHTADRLVAASDGALSAVKCPAGAGIHVWNPEFERDAPAEQI
jgi:hypothetical protein